MLQTDDIQILEYRIRSSGSIAGKYRVEVNSQPDGAYARAVISLDPAEIEEMADAAIRGERLGTALFVDDLQQILISKLDEIYGQRADLRIQLLIEPPELQSLPWEELRHRTSDGWRMLAKQPGISLVRTSAGSAWRRPLAPLRSGPVRMLIAAATPEGFRSLDSSLVAGLQLSISLQTSVSVNLVEHLTWERLRRELAGGYDVLHLICPLEKRADLEGGVVILEDGKGQPAMIPGHELGNMLKAMEPSPAFACFFSTSELSELESFKPEVGTESEIAGLAIKRGVQAAVGWRAGSHQDKQAEFFNELYGQLLTGGSLDNAINDALVGLLAQGDRYETLPVLWIIEASTRLFDVGDTPATFSSITQRVAVTKGSGSVIGTVIGGASSNISVGGQLNLEGMFEEPIAKAGAASRGADRPAEDDERKIKDDQRLSLEMLVEHLRELSPQVAAELEPFDVNDLESSLADIDQLIQAEQIDVRRLRHMLNTVADVALDTESGAEFAKIADQANYIAREMR